jgi:hypothetical protein
MRDGPHKPKGRKPEAASCLIYDLFRDGPLSYILLKMDMIREKE